MARVCGKSPCSTARYGYDELICLRPAFKSYVLALDWVVVTQPQRANVTNQEIRNSVDSNDCMNNKNDDDNDNDSVTECMGW